MRIFLISGKAGSGKSKVAEIIKKTLPATIITTFSKYIKLFALEMTPWDGLDETKPREFLQTAGDELRNIRQDFLTKRMVEDMAFYQKYYENIVIHDVRLKEEIEYFKNKTDYEIITIHIKSRENRKILTEKEKRHLTEIDLDDYKDFDYIIENNEETNLEKIVKEIEKGLV